MRAVCLALPAATEGVHFGEVVFKAGARLFASCGDKSGPRTIVFRIDAARTAELLARDPRYQRYPREKSALWIRAGDVDDWDQMRAFLEESHRLASHPAVRVRRRKARGTRRRG